MDEGQLQAVLDFAVDAARQAGDLTLKHFNSDVGYEMKADNTPVTIADREAEEFLRRRIEQAFPTHGIVGEEFGEKKGSEPARWILDPIDGTFSFICRVPLYGVLVGFEWQGKMLAGVIHAPALGETVYAAKGLGCTWCAPNTDERPARVSDVAELSQARLLHGGPKLLYKHGKGRAFERLREKVYAERGWCDAYAYLLIATGRAEIMLDPILNIWDTAAPLPVVTEAGGTLTDWSGDPTHTAPEAIATNGHLFDAVLAEIRLSGGETASR
jgi:histidinol phosphatase-like enzyme (inositol monophosphatase family)